MPSTSFDIAVAVAFAVGLLLFGISTAMLRKPAAISERPNWPALVDESLVGADRNLRLDMVERLSIVGAPWCIDLLRKALEEERDPAIKSAIASTLERH